MDKENKHKQIFKLIFSGLKVRKMKFFHLLASAQFPRLLRTPKGNPNNNTFDIFFKTLDKIPPQLFKTLDKIPPQLLKRLVLSMPKRVFEVNREKLSLH